MAKRAKRQQLKGAISIQGPSGAGKTLSSLLLAYGMMKDEYPEMDDFDVWGKIGLIDTEHERSLVYENTSYQGVTIGQFWHEPLNAPYTIERYDNSFRSLLSEGVEVIIVDSSSHAWDGEGGVQDYNQNLGGRFQDWRKTNKDAYYPMISLFTGEKYRCHVITTARTKQSYAMQTNDMGKQEVVKVGLQPIQRDSLEYEFQIALNLDMQHKVTVSKDNSEIFAGVTGTILPEHGAKINQWLSKGVDIQAERAEAERLQKEADEKERQNMIRGIRLIEEQYSLQTWVQAMEQHKSINAKTEDMPLHHLQRFYEAALSKVDEQEKIKAQAEAKKEKTDKKGAK